MNAENSPSKAAWRMWLGAIFALLLGISLSLAVAGLVLKQTLLNYNFHMQTIENQGVDQKVAAMLPGLLFEQMTGNAAPAVSALLADPSTGIAAKLIPADWVQYTLQLGVRSLIDTLESARTDLSLSVDLTPITQKIKSSSSDITSKVIDQMPHCTADQLLSYAGSALKGKAANLPFCKPGEPFNQMITPIVANWIAGLTARIPSELNIPIVSLSAAGPQTPLVRAIRLVQWVIKVRTFSLVACLLLPVLMLLINCRTLPAGLRSIGIAFLITAVGMIIAWVLVFTFSASQFVPVSGNDPLLAGLSQMAVDYVKAIISPMKTMLVKAGALFAASGVLLAFLTRGNRFVWQD